VRVRVRVRGRVRVRVGRRGRSGRPAWRTAARVSKQ
jgi:hypothetical protein